MYGYKCSLPTQRRTVQQVGGGGGIPVIMIPSLSSCSQAGWLVITWQCMCIAH